MRTPLTTAPLYTLVSAARRRLRRNRALDGAARASLPAMALLLATVVLFKVQLLSTRTCGAFVAVAIGFVLAGAVAAALKRISPLAVAHLLDARCQLADRLSSALQFADSERPTDFMRAAIDDAVAVSSRVALPTALPLEAPSVLRRSALLALIALGASFIHFPTRRDVPRSTAAPLPRFSVEKDQLQEQRELVRELAKQAEATSDPELAALAKELEQFLSAIDRGEMTRKEALEKLAELEQRAHRGTPSDFAELRERLRKAGEELGKSGLGKAAGKALAESDLERAQRELAQLAHRLEQNRQSERGQRQLANALSRASDAQQRQSEERRHLDEERRKLERQKPSPERTRQLQRNERALSQLERREEQAQRQLAELRRNLESAARNLQNGDGRSGQSQGAQSQDGQNQSGQRQNDQSGSEQSGRSGASNGGNSASSALERAANELAKLRDEERRSSGAQSGRMRIAEMREMVRRAQGSQQQQQQSQQLQQPQQTQQQPHDTPQGVRLGQFLARANGNSDGKSSALLLGQGGEKQALLPGEGQAQRAGGPSGNEARPAGDGIGDTHDPNLTGAPTRLLAQHRNERVAGTEGAGPSKSETILGASERGFASAPYRRVYSDYTRAAEESLSTDQVPPGYRAYVKRYFELIRPRN